jgi:hypothetical protein
MPVVSVAALSAGSGSVVPAGTSTAAVLTIEPAVAVTVASTVNVAVPPGARSTVDAMSPVPDASPQVPPGPATQVHVAAPSSAGSVSVTGAPTTADGPALVTTIV